MLVLFFVPVEADEVEMMKLIVNGKEGLTLNWIGMVNEYVGNNSYVGGYHMSIHT